MAWAKSQFVQQSACQNSAAVACDVIAAAFCANQPGHLGVQAQVHRCTIRMRVSVTFSICGYTVALRAGMIKVVGIVVLSALFLGERDIFTVRCGLGMIAVMLAASRLHTALLKVVADGKLMVEEHFNARCKQSGYTSPQQVLQQRALIGHRPKLIRVIRLQDGGGLQLGSPGILNVLVCQH